ncbi:MAG: hypothetical protein JNM14_02490 [Ferruginibacter sp.]|nr:hypothetical protein [Ferruginibacter sp.]
MRPFGIFIKKDLDFPESHGAPCDVAQKNPLVDRKNLDKYYLLPSDLRILKSHQIIKDDEITDFWYYYGDPERWENDDNYGKNIYQKAGEFRYYHQIKPDSIVAILWPFFTDIVLDDGSIDMNENLDLMNAFKKTFPNIKVIMYKHDVEEEYNWAIKLVEASYYSTKYYLEKGKFPKDADFAKNEILNI